MEGLVKCVKKYCEREAGDDKAGLCKHHLHAIVKSQCQVIDDMHEAFYAKRNKHTHQRDYLRFKRLVGIIKNQPKTKGRILKPISRALRIVYRHVTPNEAIEHEWDDFIVPDEEENNF